MVKSTNPCRSTAYTAVTSSRIDHARRISNRQQQGWRYKITIIINGSKAVQTVRTCWVNAVWHALRLAAAAASRVQYGPSPPSFLDACNLHLSIGAASCTPSTAGDLGPNPARFSVIPTTHNTSYSSTENIIKVIERPETTN